MQFIYRQKYDGRWKASGMGDGAAVLGTVTANGACAGISLWWIIKRSQGDDFWTWFGPPRSAAPTGPETGKNGEPIKVITEVMEAQRNQSQIVTINSRELQLDAATNYILANSNNCLLRLEGKNLGGPVEWTDLAGKATEKPGFALIALYVKAWGAHAVAANISSKGYIEWMDPNIGEVEKEDTVALKEWFEEVVGDMYGPGPIDNVRIQLLGTLFPPASKKLHEM